MTNKFKNIAKKAHTPAGSIVHVRERKMLDTYLSSIGNKTNEVMKVLTIFSTISVPLTFLTGVYGMNFVFLPELEWKYSYIVFWIITVTIIIIMMRYFKKKGWL